VHLHGEILLNIYTKNAGCMLFIFSAKTTCGQKPALGELNRPLGAQDVKCTGGIENLAAVQPLQPPPHQLACWAYKQIFGIAVTEGLFGTRSPFMSANEQHGSMNFAYE